MSNALLQVGLDDGKQKLPNKFKIVKTYWHDHSLESSRGALSDGTISVSRGVAWGQR
jgi:hypothetical protein